MYFKKLFLNRNHEQIYKMLGLVNLDKVVNTLIRQT